MVHQIKLKNVASFSDDISQENIKPKFYDIIVENRDGTSNKLTLSIAYYIHDAVHHGGNEAEASKTFDCRFYNINRDTGANEETSYIRGLKIDGEIQYDSESHTFTATADEGQAARGLDSLISDYFFGQ